MLKFIFDRFFAFVGLCCLWWVFPIIALLIKVKMPGPVLFVQERVGKDAHLFKCYKFRTMRVGDVSSSISVAGDVRVTSFGAWLRKTKIDELPELWNVLIGDMSFVGPRPDVPGYADNLEGDDRVVLSLRPGITGPATLKYRDEEELIAKYVAEQKNNGDTRTEQDIIVDYNDNVIYPDKVRINKLYIEHYSFLTDIIIILATVLGRKVNYEGELV